MTNRNEVMRCSSVVDHLLMACWVIGSIPHGGPIELFPLPASVPRLVYQRLPYVLSCLWDGVYKRTPDGNQRE